MNASDFLDGLEDDDVWASAPSENIRPFGTVEPVVTDMPPGGGYKQRCDRCQGSGKFRGYTGRILGDCRACSGAGFKTFKTSPQERLQRSNRVIANKAAWAETHADVVAWVQRRSTGDRPFQFAVELAGKLAQYGTLTDGAVAAVKRLIAQDAERRVARDAERAEVRANAPVVSVEPIVRAFSKAVAAAKAEAMRKAGVDEAEVFVKFEEPRMRLGAFFITRAPQHGKNPGALYVKRTSDREYLGKIADGRFTKAFVCDAPTEAAVVEACRDPEGAATAYGKLTGRCCCCGKKLTKHVSIARGIGPVCAEKYGW